MTDPRSAAPARLSTFPTIYPHSDPFAAVRGEVRARGLVALTREVWLESRAAYGRTDPRTSAAALSYWRALAALSARFNSRTSVLGAIAVARATINSSSGADHASPRTKRRAA